MMFWIVLAFGIGVALFIAVAGNVVNEIEDESHDYREIYVLDEDPSGIEWVC